MTSNKYISEVIQELKNELLAHFDSKMDNLQTSLNTIEASLTTIGDQVTLLEQRVSANEDNISDLEKRIEFIEKENTQLREKTEEMENRSRLHNLRFLWVPEQAEGRDILGFMKQFIPQLLGVENYPMPPVIERAHRTSTVRNPNSKSGARSILIKLLNLQDKMKILRLAREKGHLQYKGTRIYIYPDYSSALLEKCRLFDPIKKKLRELDINYSLQYPATLRVTVDGKVTTLHSPEEAEGFLPGGCEDELAARPGSGLVVFSTAVGTGAVFLSPHRSKGGSAPGSGADHPAGGGGAWI
ncbi:unnamed protein product [Leuciscus chuanchicus]